MPYKKKAPAKRTKKFVGGALSAAQKRLLGNAQAGAVKKGAGAITKQMVGMTRKYGDQRKATAAPSKASKDQMARAAIARGVPKATGKKIVAVPKRGRPVGGGATNRIGMPNRSNMTPAQKQAAMKKRMEAMRQGRVVSTRPSPTRRRAPTAAQRRAQMAAARRRAMAAARKRRAPSRRVKSPVRRPSGLSRAGLALRARRDAAARRARSAGRPTSRRPIMRRRRAEGGAMNVNAKRFARMGQRSTPRKAHPIRAAFTGVTGGYNKAHSIRSTMFSKNFQNSMMNSKEL